MGIYINEAEAYGIVAVFDELQNNYYDLTRAAHSAGDTTIQNLKPINVEMGILLRDANSFVTNRLKRNESSPQKLLADKTRFETTLKDATLPEELSIKVIAIVDTIIKTAQIGITGIGKNEQLKQMSDITILPENQRVKAAAEYAEQQCASIALAR